MLTDDRCECWSEIRASADTEDRQQQVCLFLGCNQNEKYPAAQKHILHRPQWYLELQTKSIMIIFYKYYDFFEPCCIYVGHILEEGKKRRCHSVLSRHIIGVQHMSSKIWSALAGIEPIAAVWWQLNLHCTCVITQSPITPPSETMFISWQKSKILKYILY